LVPLLIEWFGGGNREGSKPNSSRDVAARILKIPELFN
jgi:hypothetical protein